MIRARPAAATTQRLYMAFGTLETDVPRIRLFFLALAAALATTGAAQAAACKASTPSVRIQVDESKVAYDHGRSILELSMMMKGSKKRKDLKQFTHTLGITAPKFDFHGTYGTKARTTNVGACASVSNVNIGIDLAQTIFIASEVKKGSCIYKLVVSHEKKHAELNRDFLRDVGKAIKVAIVEADLQPARAKTKEDASKAASAKMDKIVGAAIEKYAAELSTKQEAVDTPKEYSRVNKVCGDLNIDKMFARMK